jgi:hypothetical protein
MATVGQILPTVPSLVNQSTVIAEKVANIAVPASVNTIWDKLGQVSSITPPLSGGLSTAFNPTYGTSKLQSLSTQLADSSRYKLNLPNLAGAPQKGIGTSMQQVAGGVGAGAAAGNTQFVDDANWPVTLKEIIGAKMLTAEQLQKASIANVKKLVSVGNPTYIRSSSENSVGTAKENEELYYMFQRMMIEGFIRGVDITKELTAQGGLDISIKTAPLASNPNNIGLSQTLTGQDQVGFNASFWRGASEAERYQLFMHEIGHSLLNRAHAAESGDIMKSGGTVANARTLLSSKEAYNAMLNDHFASATNKGTIAIAKIAAGTGVNTFDASWYPQLSGQQVSLGSNYTTGTSSSSSSTGTTTTSGTPTSTATPATSSLDQAKLDAVTANLSKLADLISSQSASQQASMAAFMQQQNVMNVMNQMPSPQAQINISSGSSETPSAVDATDSMVASSGVIDTTAFAQQLANLESGGSSNAGNLLASG